VLPQKRNPRARGVDRPAASRLAQLVVTKQVCPLWIGFVDGRRLRLGVQRPQQLILELGTVLERPCAFAALFRSVRGASARLSRVRLRRESCRSPRCGLPRCRRQFRGRSVRLQSGSSGVRCVLQSSRFIGGIVIGPQATSDHSEFFGLAVVRTAAPQGFRSRLPFKVPVQGSSWRLPLSRIASSHP